MTVERSAAQIAERIFPKTGAVGSKADAVAVFGATFHQLEVAVSAVVGGSGYRTMFARCVRRTKAKHPALAAMTLADADLFLEPLLARLRGSAPASVRAIGYALLRDFIELLETLIGIELTTKIFQRAWPDLFPGANRTESP